jgi:hypothetical protein
MNRAEVLLLSYLKRQHHRDLSDDKEIEIFHQLKDASLGSRIVDILFIVLM